ncbi:MAG: hypothetical protein HS111_22410 [Kofleriaceae bacterium]|nr:hypothetical protein [Kofleriaceae bacterium]
MLRPGTIALAIALVAAAGCEGKKPEGLPPALDWQAPPTGAGAMPAMPHAGGGGGRIDPHAGGPGAPPLGGGLGGMGGDPHAGVPGRRRWAAAWAWAATARGACGAPPLGGAWAARGGGGVDVTQLGLPPPDPSRSLDPQKVLTGTVTLGAAHAGKVPPGAVIFLAVRAVDPATGQGVGMPIAADRLVVGSSWPIPFRLDEADAMIAGTGFTGDVLITARYDQDHEARSRQPGDIVGQVRATIPAHNLVISLDEMLP